jgi:aminopeptidase N
MKKVVLFIILIFNATQAQQFTRKDSLKGGLAIERKCFDVKKYALDLVFDIEQKQIKGSNTINFAIVYDSNRIQLDLFANMVVDSIVYNKQKLQYTREFDAVFVDFSTDLTPDIPEYSLQFYYHGQPKIAANAPWDGGFVYHKDSNGKPFIGVAVQGEGASLWFPCKDSQSDEPDLGASIKITVPKPLMAVSNGRFIAKVPVNASNIRWEWEVKNPINAYDITLYVGDFVHFGENYKGLDLDYYVLRENEAKAKTQFAEVKPMLDCFQQKFGPYPFANDGFKLVEAPYLGMEHQSAVAYGNGYQKGYLGTDLSGTGKGLLFDFILVHESGHEWFGNSITSKDVADMWIHEGFTCYSESVYLECAFDKETALTYLNGLKKNVKNDRPIIGAYGLKNEGSGDMYYKGALLLNTIRSYINNDERWWQILKNYSTTFAHQIIDNKTVIDFFSEQSGLALAPIFNQYLAHQELPVLEWKLVNNQLSYRWNCAETGFKLPATLLIKGKEMRVYPENKWKSMPLVGKTKKDILVKNTDFYILSKGL